MRIKLAIAALATAIIAAPAQANDATSNGFSIQVPHADLDLTTQEGVSRLDDRVQTRIRQMCRTGSRDQVALKNERACRENARNQAAQSVRLAVAEANADKKRLALLIKGAPNAETPAA